MKRFILFSLCIVLVALSNAQTRKGSVTITGDVKVSELVKKHIEFNEHMPTVPGFRIQLHSFSGANSRNQAFDLKKRFKEEYPDVEVYIIFVEPDFRVKVGDFTSKLDAFVFLRRIKDRYPGTILPDRVYPIHRDWSDIIPETDSDSDI